jgi:hypothetical protein
VTCVSGGRTLGHPQDWGAVIRNPAALDKLKIPYEPPAELGYPAFFICGDGSLVGSQIPRADVCRLDSNLQEQGESQRKRIETAQRLRLSNLSELLTSRANIQLFQPIAKNAIRRTPDADRS